VPWLSGNTDPEKNEQPEPSLRDTSQQSL
jgi:hypothetical protein